ncbi:hypothetical protein SHIRM173S_10359 [Streptomyces hirsutus]
MRDDVDLCWRDHTPPDGGSSVAPDGGRAGHAEAASRERRTVDCAGRTTASPHKVDKAGAVHTLPRQHPHRRPCRWVLLRLVLGTLLRTAAPYLVGKVPGPGPRRDPRRSLGALLRPRAASSPDERAAAAGRQVDEGRTARRASPPPGATIRVTVEQVAPATSVGALRPPSSSTPPAARTPEPTGEQPYQADPYQDDADPDGPGGPSAYERIARQQPASTTRTCYRATPLAASPASVGGGYDPALRPAPTTQAATARRTTLAAAPPRHRASRARPGAGGEAAPPCPCSRGADRARRRHRVRGVLHPRRAPPAADDASRRPPPRACPWSARACCARHAQRLRPSPRRRTRPSRPSPRAPRRTGAAPGSRRRPTRRERPDGARRGGGRPESGKDGEDDGKDDDDEKDGGAAKSEKPVLRARGARQAGHRGHLRGRGTRARRHRRGPLRAPAGPCSRPPRSPRARAGACRASPALPRTRSSGSRVRAPRPSRTDYVHLTNPDDSAAVVDIELYGKDGVLETDGGGGHHGPAALRRAGPAVHRSPTRSRPM